MNSPEVDQQLLFSILNEAGAIRTPPEADAYHKRLLSAMKQAWKHPYDTRVAIWRHVYDRLGEDGTREAKQYFQTHEVGLEWRF